MAMKKTKNSHRWKKGHSCVSNPENTSHREAAKGRFFQKIEGESSLTVDALAKHAAALSVEPNNYTTLCANAEDDQSVGKSFNTFATHFTTCTIPAFEKFFVNFNIESDIHKRMLAVHAIAQEYLQENGLPETSTSYMCAFLVSLEGVKESEEDVAATLSLMARVIRKVSPEVLKIKYGEFEKLLFEILTSYANSENKNIIVNILGCFSMLLRAQYKTYWDLPFAINLLQSMMLYTTCEDIKVRKCAQYSVSAILKGSSFMSTEDSNDSEEEMDDDVDIEKQLAGALRRHFKIKPMILHPAAKDVGEFILDKLKLATNTNNGKETLYLLIFLQQVICQLPRETLKKCCATIVGIMHIGDSIVTGRALKVLQTLFSSEVTTALEKEVNEGLINALIHSKPLKLIPNMNDAPVCLTWMTTVAYGILHYMRLDERGGVNFATQFISLMTAFWKSDHRSVHEQVFFSIEYLLDDCFEPLGQKLASIYANEALIAFKAVEEALSYQYEAAWPCVFKSLSAFYRVIGKFHSQDMMNCLKNLSEMSANADMSHRDLIESVIGAIIKNIGPEMVLKAVPFQITGNVLEDEKYFWILPLLTQYVKGARLCFFVSYFIPLANKCTIIIKKYSSQLSAKSNDHSAQVLVNTYETVERQIWFLFKSFANEAVDIKEAISKDGGSFAKLIFDHMKLRMDIRVDILKGLRNIISSSKDEPEEMIKYSKNYLPALFNLYLNTPNANQIVDSGHRLAVYDTILKYLEIVPSSIALRFFKEVMRKYEPYESNELKTSASTSLATQKSLEIISSTTPKPLESTSPAAQKALLNLARAFIPYLDQTNLSMLYEKVNQCLKSKDSNVQKTVYKVIEDIFGLQNKNFYQDHYMNLIDLLTNTYKTVVRNAWAPRLKCYYLLLTSIQGNMSEISRAKLMKQIVKEVINCCGAKHSIICRKNAFALLIEIGNTTQRLQHLSEEETFGYYFTLLPSLDLQSPTISNTIAALRFLSYKYRDLFPMDRMTTMTSEVSSFLPNSPKGIVKSSLAFIRLMFVLNPSVVMSNLVDGIVKSILKISIELRKKLRFQIRDLLACFIRKFGSERIRALVPEKDNLRKLLIGVVKTENRKKRIRKLNSNKELPETEEREIAPSSLDEILAEIDRDIEDDEVLPAKKKDISKGKTSKKQTWIVEDEDDIVDLLDVGTSQNIKKKEPKSKVLRFADEETPKTDEEKYGFRVDRRTNKFIITEKWDPQEDKKDEDDDMVALDGLYEMLLPSKPTKPQDQSVQKRKRTLSQTSIDSDQAVKKLEPKIAPGKKFDYGAEFRSKKAGGDKTKKSGVAPYAYVQFSKEKLNRRKKSKFAGQFRELVKGRKGKKSNASLKKKKKS